MPALVISVHVSPRAAILAGKAHIGSQSFTLTDPMLADLDPEMRLELALAYESGEPIGKNPDEPPVVEATLAAILPVLQRRAERRKELADGQRVQAARDAEVATVNARDIVAKDNARSKALRVWIDKNGDEDQKARMAEGYLREEEILEAICEELLDLPGFQLYDPLRKGNVCDCACAGRARIVETTPPRYMDGAQFGRFQTARESAPEGAIVTAVEHRGACPACNCAPIARLEARVTMAWHGWLLVRQYALI